MKLELLRTYVTLKAYNHNIKPEIMSIGGFSINLDNINVEYDHDEHQGGWIQNTDDVKIHWVCRDGCEIYCIDSTPIEKRDCVLGHFDNVPSISKITEVAFEAFNSLKDYEEHYEFDVEEFIVVLIDRDTDKFYEVCASDDVIKEYNKSLLSERLDDYIDENCSRVTQTPDCCHVCGCTLTDNEGYVEYMLCDEHAPDELFCGESCIKEFLMNKLGD